MFEKKKNIKGNKNKMTNKLLCCAQPPSLQKKKEKQTKQTKKETKSILANFLLWLCLAFISAKKKTNKKRKPKKHRRQQRAEWKLLAVTLSGLHLCMTTTCSGQWPRVNANNADGKLKKKIIRKFCYFKQEVGNMARHFFQAMFKGKIRWDIWE